MRHWLIAGAFGAALAAAGVAQAAATLEIRGAAARVAIIPESRADIDVTVVQADRQLPIRLRRLGDRVFVSGDVGHHVRACALPDGKPGVAIFGRPSVPFDQLPRLVIRTPLAVRVIAGEAVFGQIGPAASVELTNQGCGGWVLAEVRGRLKIDQAGSGQTRAGGAGSGDLSVVGGGGVVTGPILGGLTAVSSGAGDIAVAAVAGRVDARVGGSGGILLASGAADAVTVSIAGSGSVRFLGTARSLKALIAGSGDISVARVTGAVSKHVFGPGKVRVGP